VTYALTFAAFGVVQAAWGWTLGGAGALLVWSGFAWCVVAAGYAGAGPRVFGKRADGRIAAAHTAALLPFLAFMWSVWRVRARRGRFGHEIAPGLWLGRRPLGGELPDSVTAVVDLTSEFPKSRDLGSREYLCVPLLDATAPDAATIARVVEWIGARSGAVYVHCAAGNGRSAIVVAAVVLARGLATDATSAVEFVRRARPSIRPNRAQLAVLGELNAAR
jgi:protein-tyrosine phosphatase